MRLLIAVQVILLGVPMVACTASGPAGVGPSVPPVTPQTVVTPTPAALPPPAPVRPIGRLNPAVTQDTISTTVCTPGWTEKIRPPTSFTNAVKRAQLPAGADPAAYEEDHLMPLALGGAPRDVANLAPIPWGRAKLDDVWETRLHRMLCAGEVSLRGAQIEISIIKRTP